jgi:hypothetical protein
LFVGDTGYNEHQFRAIGERLGPFDLALLPIGAYAPRWFMQEVHINPEEAVRIHRDFVARQWVYNGKDGAKITMFITHKRGLELDGDNTTLLYGYGGFNNSMTPFFSTSRIVWMEMGGVWAMPNIRGGGERGEDWHKAGMRENKQNVFDDFIAAAEGLIANKYTSKGRLAIAGGSNGGLLVGACMTQRPDLFGACLPAVGVMDMMRYHEFTVGSSWVGEYGSSDEQAMVPVLLAYSPYHNLKKGVHYPPTLVTTADHDDRVVPGHSFKFAARLQACQGGPAPGGAPAGGASRPGPCAGRRRFGCRPGRAQPRGRSDPSPARPGRRSRPGPCPGRPPRWRRAGRASRRATARRRAAR